VLERLLVQRMQNRVAGSVGGRAGALRRAFTVMRGHPAKGALIDLAFFGARKRHAVMLEFDDGRGGFFAHVLDRVLITEPVGTFDRVVHMPAPVVFAHVAKGRTHAALGRNRVTARGEYFGDAGRLQAGVRHPEGGAQSGTAGAHDDDVVAVVNNLVAVCQDVV